MDVTRLEQRAYSGLWMLWGIYMKVYEYEYGSFKITCTRRNFSQIINTSSTMFPCFFMICQSCQKSSCHDLIPTLLFELLPIVLCSLARYCFVVFNSWGRSLEPKSVSRVFKIIRRVKEVNILFNLLPSLQCWVGYYSHPTAVCSSFGKSRSI